MVIDTIAERWKNVPHPEAAASLRPARLRLADEFLNWVGSRAMQISADDILQDWDHTISTTRMDALLSCVRALFGEGHPLCLSVKEARRQRRREYLARYAPKTDTEAAHWASARHPEAAAALSARQLAKVDDFLRWVASKDVPITSDSLLQEWDNAKSEAPLKLLLQSLVPIFGSNDPLCAAVEGAAKIRCSEHRRSRRGRPKIAPPSREEILARPHWGKFRASSSVRDMSMEHLRLVDRFFTFCTKRKITDITPEHVLAFLPTHVPSRFWELRVALEALYGLRHPIPHVVEEARQLRWQDYARNSGIVGRSDPPPARALTVSVPEDVLPASWRDVLDRMEKGERVRGRRLAAAAVRGMRQAARELVFFARESGMPDELSEDTVRVYDASFETRSLKPMSCAALILGLWRLARALGISDVQDSLHELHAYYRRLGLRDQQESEIRYAALPGLPDIFDRAVDLLRQGRIERHASRRTTLLVDAAAMAFLSLIPLRNGDTVVRWGEHLSFDENGTTDWIYRIDTSITKTGVMFGGALHPILNPFIEAVILRGRDEMFLPKLRRAAIETHAPVFPTSNGKARCASGLSQRWQKILGAGSHIARKQAHTLLGALGPKGVEAALALCAQRSPETRLFYQAEALGHRLMRDSQSLLAAALPEDLVAERVDRFKAEQRALSGIKGGIDRTRAD